MLYIEQPAGVGYSYCDNKTAPQDCKFDDDSDAKDNLEVLISWFGMFPEYAKTDLYISGESYAGIYVPYLANQIYEHNKNATSNDTVYPNLKGFMVGNGVTNWNYDGNPSYVEMAYWHSLYPQEMHDEMIAKKCNYSMSDFDDYYKKLPVDCKDLLDKFNTIVKDVNVYDIFGYCWPNNETSMNLFHRDHINSIAVVGGMPLKHKTYFTSHDYTPWLR